MDVLLRDLLYAGRCIRRRPATALLAIVMLAIGTGATTAMFTVVDRVVVQDAPYAQPGRLVTIWQTFPHWRGQPALDAQWDRIALAYGRAAFSVSLAAPWRVWRCFKLPIATSSA